MSDRPDQSDHTHGSDDPRDIRSIAVTTDDVVAALEANRRSARRTVLRVTPPFAGRMRARIHREGGEGAYDGPAAPIHVDPESLVDSSAPEYPEPDDSEDELRRAGTFTAERHRERHVAAVEEWRTEVRAHLVAETRIETPDGPHRVGVKTLG
ncbi:MAG: hypothetical protein ACQETI_10565 [Halobacteriota archaeon]